MRLIEIEVRAFRGLEGPVRAQFGPGLNVIHGLNETGKTTLLDAVRHALTLKARIGGKPFEKIQPRGGGSPSVVLGFEHAGATFRLEKTWTGESRTATTRLVEQRDGRVVADLSGDEAEDRLRDLLCLSDPARGERKPEQLGCWPLLWIEQGLSGQAPGEALTEGSRATLSERLSAISGVLLGGEAGDTVLRKALELESEIWTTKGLSTREAAPHVVAERRLHAAEATLAALKDEALRIEQDDSDLANVDGELRQREAGLPLLDQAIEEARSAAAEAESLRRAAEKASALAEKRDLEAQAAGHVLRARQERVAALARARADRLALAASEEDLRARLGSATRQRDEARAAAGTARDADDAASTASRRLRDAVAWTEASASHRAALATLAEAGSLEDAIRGIEATNAADRATTDWGRDVERLADAARSGQLRLNAAAARVEITALGPGLSVKSDGEIRELPQGETFVRDLVETWEAEFADLARVRVRPGGEDLESLRAAASAADRLLAAELAQGGCADVVSARRAVERRVERERDLVRMKKDLARLAPAGSEALKAEAARCEARVADFATRLGLATGAGSVPGLPESLDDLRAAADAAERQEQLTRKSREDAAGLLARLEKEAEGLAGEHRVALVGLGRVDDDVLAHEQGLREQVDAAGADSALEDAARTAELSASEARSEAEAARQQASAPAVEAAAERLARAKRARSQAAEDLAKLATRREVLADRLGSRSAGGLSARIAAAEAELDSARREHVAAQAHAKAVRRLADALREARSQVEARFQEPLRKQIEPLLALLFPEAKTAFGKGFDLESLQRGHELDAFEELSGGAQEQVAVIVRLGLACLLAGDERLLVLLDEPLNDTDHVRLAAMFSVLGRCSEKLQIVVSTSQLERWSGLGAETRIDLAALKSAARGAGS